jgi:hypothetical protein
VPRKAGIEAALLDFLKKNRTRIVGTDKRIDRGKIAGDSRDLDPSDPVCLFTLRADGGNGW